MNLFTNIGAPQIWNGEEMGMWGADDPHCRKPLWWKEYNFEPENNVNLKTGVKTVDKVEFNQQHYDFYKKLISIRKANPVLANGEFAFLTTDGKKLAYKRFDKQNEIIVLFNVDKSKQTFTLPAKATYINLLTNEKFEGNSLALNTLTAAILKKVK